MTRRTTPILAILALALAALLTLTALAAPAAIPTAWFTANLPTPVALETVTPLEQALLDRIAGAATSIDAAFYDIDRPAIRDALLAAHQRGVTVRAITDLETVTGPDAAYGAALVAGRHPRGRRRQRCGMGVG